MSLMDVFEVRDFRDKNFFITDDAFLNGWAKFLARAVILVYLALCRHSNSNQKSFPSISFLAKKLGLTVLSVKRGIKTLETLGMIAVVRDKGRHNIYYLLDKKAWIKPGTNEEKSQTGIVSDTGIMGDTGIISIHKTGIIGDTLRIKKKGIKKPVKKPVPGFLPVLEFYLSKTEEAKGFKPELPKKDFSILSKALKKHPEDRIRNIILFFLDNEKSEKHISLSAALSADTINQYKARWHKLKHQYGDDAVQPAGEERWWV